VARQHSAVLPLTAHGVDVTRGGRQLLAGIELDIQDTAAITVLLGPNGAGKSLLVRMLCGLAEPDAGRVTWAGTPPDRARMAKIGVVFQRPIVLNRTALANIDYALTVTGTPPSERKVRAAAALAQAGLSHLANQPAQSLSGGEQQRLALARALACRPDVLILDEPTANLDPASTRAIEELLRGCRSAGTPVLFITHDLAQARRLADHVVFMHSGRIIERTPAAQFFISPPSPEATRFISGELLA
jgi:tungstate transport system ATP-binding protein